MRKQSNSANIQRKTSKELRQEAQNIQIVVTSSDQAADDQNHSEVQQPRVRILKNTTKNLAFAPDEDKIEYSIGDGLFAEVRILVALLSIKFHLLALYSVAEGRWRV